MILMSIFLVKNVSAETNISLQDFNNSDVCRKTYYFIIDHIDYSGNFKYNSQELLELLNNINADYSLNSSFDEIKIYVDNFNNVCSSSGFNVPKSSINKSLTIFFNPINNSCEYKWNNSFLGYDLDYSIDFFKIYQADTPCNTLRNQRLIFNIEKTDTGYVLTGIKSYLLLFLIFTIIIVDLYRTNSLISKITRGG